MGEPINDGGPAFPHIVRHHSPDILEHITTDGMSLRDWFAGQALVGMLAGQWNVAPNAFAPQRLPANTSELVSNAYAVADAMLAERAKAKGGET